LRTEMGAGAADIAQVVAELRASLPDIPPAQAHDPEQARFRFFDSVTTFLKTAAGTQPLVLVFDDIHWADASSLLLLQFFIQQAEGSQLLVILTCRDGELHRGPILAQTLAVVARAPGNQTLPLQRFTGRDVARFLELTIGQSASPSIVSAVYKETEGNPFFVTEVVRLLATESDDSAIRNSQSAITLVIPQSVRSVLERRLSYRSE